MGEPDGRQDRALESGQRRACEAAGRPRGGLVDARFPRIVLCAVPAVSPQGRDRRAACLQGGAETEELVAE